MVFAAITFSFCVAMSRIFFSSEINRNNINSSENIPSIPISFFFTSDTVNVSKWAMLWFDYWIVQDIYVYVQNVCIVCKCRWNKQWKKKHHNNNLPVTWIRFREKCWIYGYIGWNSHEKSEKWRERNKVSARKKDRLYFPVFVFDGFELSWAELRLINA